MLETTAFVIHEDDCVFEESAEVSLTSVRWRTLISADRTPTNSLTVGIADVAAGESTVLCPHKHAHTEIYYILSGEGTITISGVRYPLRPGTAVFIPGGAEHVAQNTGGHVLRLLYVFPANAFGDIEYEFLEC